MGKDNLLTQINLSIVEIGVTENFMVKENLLGQINHGMKEVM